MKVKQIFNRKFGKNSIDHMLHRVMETYDKNYTEDRLTYKDVFFWLTENYSGKTTLPPLNLAPYMKLEYIKEDTLSYSRVILTRMDTILIPGELKTTEVIPQQSPENEQIDSHNEKQIQEEQTKIDKEMENQEQVNTTVVKVKGDDGKYYFVKPDGSKFNYTFKANAPMIIVRYNFEKRLLTFKSGISRDNQYAPVSELVHQWFKTHGYDSSSVLFGAPKSINEVKVYNNVFNVQMSQAGKFFVKMVWENNDPNKGLVGPDKFKNFIRFNVIK